ncbi:hypothetical protein KEJ47_09645, partial [Candidatus Bathyarchaeota archaeon]|nr:hypothetical protein [Candidatus Bathyarchaeota archaeon]
ARVPLTTHQGSGKLCQPVDQDGGPLILEPGFVKYYRSHGIGRGLIETAIRKHQGRGLFEASAEAPSRRYPTLHHGKP